MYVDAHCHLADLRISDTDREKIIREALDKKISLFLQAGIDPQDWQRQQDLQKKFPENILISFGLHPYFVAAHTRDECEEALDLLAQKINVAAAKGPNTQHAPIAVGEVGLDFREQFVEPTGHLLEPREQQITFFENQIALAKVAHKPMILHVVKAHEEALKILKIWDPPERGGMVHAFNSSSEIAKKYLDLGFLISIGGAVTYDKNKKLKNTVSELDLESILLESDSPDQPPQDWPGQNSPASLWLVATEIAKIKDISPLKVLEQATLNFKSLFRV